MSWYSDEEKEPFLNNDSELGCTSLNNRKQNARGMNFLIQIRNAFWFTIYFVKNLLKNSTQFFMAADQSNASSGEDDQIDWAIEKVRWKDLDGNICYGMLSFPERIQYGISWLRTSESIYPLAKWKLLLKDYPVLGTVFSSAKLGTVVVCTVLDAARCAGLAKSWLPVVPGHPYRKISIMNFLASAFCVEDALYFQSVGNTPGALAAGIISGCCFLINLSTLVNKFRSPPAEYLEELKKFLEEPIARKFLPQGVINCLHKEAHGVTDAEMQDNHANEAETGANSTN